MLRNNHHHLGLRRKFSNRCPVPQSLATVSLRTDKYATIRFFALNRHGGALASAIPSLRTCQADVLTPEIAADFRNLHSDTQSVDTSGRILQEEEPDKTRPLELRSDATSFPQALAVVTVVLSLSVAQQAAALAPIKDRAIGQPAAAGGAPSSNSAAVTEGASRQKQSQTKTKKAGRSRSTKGATGEEDMMGVEERQEWVKGLPEIRETIAYSDVLELKAADNLKYIIKLPQAALQVRPERVLAVLGDERVVKVVLPAPERDPKFWRAWKDGRLDDLVINAYSPPTAPAQMLPWGFWGPSLKFLEDLGVVRWVAPHEKARAGKAGEPKAGGKAGVGGKGEVQSEKERAQAAIRERLRRVEEARREAERSRREVAEAAKNQMAERLAREREERRQWERELREQREREAKAKKAASTQQREKKAKTQALQGTGEGWGAVYRAAAENEALRFLMGVSFFFFFYYGIILNIKKQRKDYEDRVKLQKAAEEERRKLETWEEEMAELEAKEAEEEERRMREEQGAGAKAGSKGGSLTPGPPQLSGRGKEEAESEGKKEEKQNEGLAAALRFMRSGARVKRARRGKRVRRPTYLDLGEEVRFSDVAGLGEIRRELEEVVDFFQSAEKYRRRGSKIPTGILLCGDPGCGKTLLAKAVAGEAGVNFFSVSASQFVEIFVGVGASRVRALYSEARENAPAVVFIDELDAVGRQRGLTEGSGGQERDATLNQLLTCLDGFEGKGDVITIAATNRPDILDTALVRPGRFDRKIYIPKPSTRGRAQILQVHARNKLMADDVDYDVVAEITDGMSGAELANVVEVAALKVLRDGRTEITTDDLLEAAVLEEGYPRVHELSPGRLRQLALNEAAQAAVAYNFPEFRNIQVVTVTPRMTEEKGEVRFKVDAAMFKSHLLPLSVLREYVTVQMAPMVADQMWNPPDKWCTIWADHVDAARKMARQLAINGLTARAERERLYGWSVTKVEDAGRMEAIDEEAMAIVEACRQRAKEILNRNRDLVNALVDKLMEVKTMQKEEFVAVAETYGVFEEPPLSVMELRDRDVMELRERLMAGGAKAAVGTASVDL